MCPLAGTIPKPLKNPPFSYNFDAMESRFWPTWLESGFPACFAGQDVEFSDKGQGIQFHVGPLRLQKADSQPVLGVKIVELSERVRESSFWTKLVAVCSLHVGGTRVPNLVGILSGIHHPVPCFIWQRRCTPQTEAHCNATPGLQSSLTK